MSMCIAGKPSAGSIAVLELARQTGRNAGGDAMPPAGPSPDGEQAADRRDQQAARRDDLAEQRDAAASQRDTQAHARDDVGEARDQVGGRPGACRRRPGLDDGGAGSGSGSARPGSGPGRTAASGDRAGAAIPRRARLTQMALGRGQARRVSSPHDPRTVAKAQAERLIAPLGDRWTHVQAVANKARSLAAVLSAEDADLLVVEEELDHLPTASTASTRQLP